MARSVGGNIALLDKVQGILTQDLNVAKVVTVPVGDTSLGGQLAHRSDAGFSDNEIAESERHFGGCLVAFGLYGLFCAPTK